MEAEGAHAGAGVEALAAARGLALEPTAEVRELTPALITGSRGSVGPLVAGELAPGLDGRLFEHRFAAGGSRRASAIVLTEVPETAAYAPALVCRDRGSFGDRNPAQLPAERWAETELESAAFNRRYVLLALAGQDPGWIRELFSPRLIAWLAGEAQPGLSFELNEGNLAVVVPGPLTDLEAAQRLCATAAELAARLRAEATEEEHDPDLFDESAELAAIEAALGKVTFERPPPTVAAAVDAYRAVAARTPSVIVSALFWAVLVGGIAALILALVAFPLLGLAGGLVCAVATFSLARTMAASRYQWGTASVSRVGLEAFVREYARSRRLELLDRWRFHSDHRALAMPGFADHVLAGEVPELELPGVFVLFGDAAEMRSLGTEVAFTADRPLAANAIVVTLEPPPSAAAVEAAKLPEEYRAALAGSDLIVWRPVQGNLLRTAQGSDCFRERAGSVIRGVVEAPRG